MSLLMDALKKAELAKRQGQAEPAGNSTAAESAGELSLKPLSNTDATASAPAAAGSESPPPVADSFAQSSRLEELDARFLEEAEQAAASRLRVHQPQAPAASSLSLEAQPRPPLQVEEGKTPSERGAAVAAGKSAAQNLFAAKQTEKPPSRKAFALVVGVLTVLAVGGIGGYFWWQLQPRATMIASPGSVPVALPAAAIRPAVVPAPAVAPAASQSASPLAAASASAPTPAAGTRAAKAGSDDDDDSMRIPARARSQVRRPAPLAPTQDEDESPIRLTKAPLKVSPALLRGFDAFNRGDLASAQAEYERAQKADPKNTDVLHGLAAIAVRQGRAEQAELLYRRIAEADPQDAVAQAALINGRSPVDPGMAESRLKTLAAAQPELAAPHFALGNLYARHGRWSEAQQAYFRAHNAEPENPDILYNLAISLEHLRQSRLAGQYYGKAIAAAQGRAAGFDKAQAAARQQALQP